MTQHDPNSESPDAADLATTRRNTLKATGGLGLGSLLQLGGGPEADAMSEYRVPTYRVPESDLDSPGVVGRRVEITSGGATYETGDQLVDTGSSWKLIDAGVGSLNADRQTINRFGLTVEISASQTISNATVTKIQLGTATGDTSTPVNFDAANDRLVIQEDGLYFVSGAVKWSSDSGWTTGDRTAAIIQRNGQALTQTETPKTGILDETVSIAAKIYELSENDILTLNCFQDSGGERDVADSSTSTYIAVGGGI